jgi:hypothetical protein
MADRPSSSERDGSADRGPPRWVKVSGIIALVLILLVLIVLLVGGNHRPGRHQSSRGYGGPPPLVAMAARD